MFAVDFMVCFIILVFGVGLFGSLTEWIGFRWVGLDMGMAGEGNILDALLVLYHKSGVKSCTDEVLIDCSRFGELS